MRCLSPILGLLLLAACGASTVDDGFYVHDAGNNQFADVKLSFDKDAKAGMDAKPGDALADAADAKDTATADVKDGAGADVIKTDVKPADVPIADAEEDAAADVAADVAKPDVASDSGSKPDIPGCVAKPETCNGADDDCNGETDEACDDGEPCTIDDTCSFSQCFGTIKNCNDGDACTADTCVSGNCDHPVYPCNDNNPCTADTCDPASGCTHPPLTDACDDGNPCTQNDSCGTGVCAGTLDPCDDANACTSDACVVGSGCKHTNNTAACDDGNPCTSADVCTAGVCAGGNNPCEDGNACTDDTCDGGVCGHVNNAATCSDGDGCTTGDSCSAGMCVAGAATNCDDGLSCTTDACSAGACSHADTCPANNKCDAVTNACILTGCALPANACANGTQSRWGCQNGRVIGRSIAKGSSGFKKSDSTCNSSNYFGGGGGQCFDTGYDHTYRIFLRKGEAISIAYSGYQDDCSFSGGSSSTQNVEIIQLSSGCGEPSSGSCSSYVKCTSKSSASYTAPAEGWYGVIADSQSWGADGYQYTLTVKLDPATCQVAGCECL